MASPLDLPVAEMARRVRDPRDPTTARALVDESLRRIRALDAKVHAFLHVAEDAARRRADSIDARVGRGEDAGPLAGVPVAVKDNLAVASMPMTCASRLLGGYVPARDATAIERVLGAGAVVVGKTNLDEFAMGSSTENSAFGPTRNPFDLARVPGGSSGGSAAAVAAGMVPVALGSDTGGSIRQPASLCGIVGLKPTYGRVSRSGLTAFASSLDQVGPLARTAADAEALYAAIVGPDPLDATTRRFDATPPPPPARSLRVGMCPQIGAGTSMTGTETAHAGDPEVKERVAQVVQRLQVAPVSVEIPAFSLGIPVYYLLAPAECSSNLARFDGVRYGARVGGEDVEALYAATREAGFGPEVKRRILLGTFALSAGYADAYYKRAMAVRTILHEQFRAGFEHCDVLLSATSPFPAFKVGEKADDPVAMYLCDVLTVTANLVGIPAISVPAGTTHAGLPIGVQVWAPWGREDLCFSVARAIAEATGFGYEAPAISKEVA